MSNESETIKATIFAMKVYQTIKEIDHIPEIEMDHMTQRKHMQIDAIEKAMQEYADLQNAELKAEIERLKEEYSRLEYKCEYGIWPKPGM